MSPPVVIVKVPVVVSEVSLLSAGSATSPEPSTRALLVDRPVGHRHLGTESAATAVVETVADDGSPSRPVIV